MKNIIRAAVAVTIALIPLSLSSPVSGAWPCYGMFGFNSCTAMPGNGTGGFPGFHMPGMPGGGGMPGLPAAPPIAAPPPMPIAPPVMAPPPIAPPVMAAAPPPMIAPPVVAPPPMPVVAAPPPAPMIAPPMAPPPVVEAAAPPVLPPPVAPAVPVAAPPGMPDMTPLQNSLHDTLTAPPAPAAPPSNPLALSPGMQNGLQQAIANGEPKPAELPAAPAIAPPPGAPAPLAAPGPNGAPNVSTLPEGQAISGITGAPMPGQPGIPSNPGVPPATSAACAMGSVAACVAEGAPQAGQLPPAPAPLQNNNLPPAPSPSDAPPIVSANMEPGAAAPIPSSMLSADPKLGTPYQQFGGSLPPTASMTSLPQGWVCGGVPEGVSSIGVSSAACGGVTGQIPYPPTNANPGYGVTPAATPAVPTGAPVTGQSTPQIGNNNGGSYTVPPGAEQYMSSQYPRSACYDAGGGDTLCGHMPDFNNTGSAVPLGASAPAPSVSPPTAPVPPASGAPESYCNTLIVCDGPISMGQMPPTPDAGPPGPDPNAAPPADPNASPPPQQGPCQNGATVDAGCGSPTPNANNDNGSQCMTQGFISGQPDRVVLVDVILVDNPNPTPNLCVPRGHSGGNGPLAQTQDPNNNGLGVLNTPGSFDPYSLCGSGNPSCIEATHNSQQVYPTNGQNYGGATFSSDCAIGGSCWTTPDGSTVPDPRPVFPGGQAMAAPTPPAAPAPPPPPPAAPPAPALVPTGNSITTPAAGPDYGPNQGFSGANNSVFCHMQGTCVPVGQ